MLTALIGLKEIQAAWATLREEARPLFTDLNIWRADLVLLDRRR